LLTGTARRDTLIVGVSESVDLTHAPVPLTEAERLVFAPFFGTLVRVDCDGRMLPGLAQRWSRVEDDGRRWRFTLRDDARFWDGTPVTAGDIASAWAGNPLVAADSVAAPDQRTLTVVLPQPDSLGPSRSPPGRRAASRAGA
jgi:peptide/nickel transport system substrate-binding protein